MKPRGYNLFKLINGSIAQFLQGFDLLSGNTQGEVYIRSTYHLYLGGGFRFHLLTSEFDLIAQVGDYNG